MYSVFACFCNTPVIPSLTNYHAMDDDIYFLFLFWCVTEALGLYLHDFHKGTPFLLNTSKHNPALLAYPNICTLFLLLLFKSLSDWRC